MKKGAEVVTVGGLHGTLVERNERTMVLMVKDGSLLEFDLLAAAKVTEKETEA